MSTYYISFQKKNKKAWIYLFDRKKYIEIIVSICSSYFSLIKNKGYRNKKKNVTSVPTANISGRKKNSSSQMYTHIYVNTI